LKPLFEPIVSQFISFHIPITHLSKES